MDTTLIEKLFQQQMTVLDDTQQRAVADMVNEVRRLMEQRVNSPQARSFVSETIRVPLVPVNAHIGSRIIECARLTLYTQGIFVKSDVLSFDAANGVPMWKFRASLFPQDLL